MVDFLNQWCGIIGALIGVLGAGFGSYCSIRNTNGPRERALMVKASAWGGMLSAVVVGLVFVLLFALPQDYKAWGFLPMLLIVPVLVIGTPYCNRRQAQIRAEEFQASGAE